MSRFLRSLHKTSSPFPVIADTNTSTNDNTTLPQFPSPNSQHSQSSHQYTSSRPISKSELSRDQQHEYDDDDDDIASITPSMNERAFSVVSFSIHRGHSIGSVNTIDSVDSGDPFAGSASTIRFNASKPGVGTCVAGDRRSPGVVLDSRDAKDTKGAQGEGLKKLSMKGIQVIGTETKRTRSGFFFRSSSLLSTWWSRLTTRLEEVKRSTTTTEDIGKLEEGQEQDIYPDGGLRAWLMVFGAMCNTFSTFGYVNSWGIFQAYYQTTLLSTSTPSNIAWIGSIQYSLVFLPGLITGRLFDLGYFHSVFLPCSILLVLATFLVAECHVYWQFLLCQGLAVGLACGGIFGPTAAVIAHWFKKRRGMAMGLVAIGSSIGGSVLPITAQALISRVGFKWTMRIFGLILILTLGVTNLILKRRLPVRKDLPGGLFNLVEFKRSAAYSVYCASAFTAFLGIYTVLTYIDVSAERTPGVGRTKVAFYLVAIANASSLVGRYVAGVACDKVGAINVMAPFTTVAGLVTFAWPFAKSKEAFTGVAVIYGFCSGSYVSLLANPLMGLGDASDVGRRVGMFMSILALGALAGPPISGAINRATGGFEAVGMYAGSMILLGVVMMVVARWLVLRRWLGRI